MHKPVLHFASQKDCKAAIRQEVDRYRDQPEIIFEAPITRELLATRHYGCVRYGLTPVFFKWGVHPHYGTDHCFKAFFEDQRFPELHWRKISFNKAVRGWELTEQTLDGELKTDALRRRALPHIQAYRDAHPYCETAGCTYLAQDVHHVDPNFDTIATAAIKLLTPHERRALIASHNWLRDFWPIPERVLEYIDIAHASARLQAFCKFHHRLSHYGE